MKKKKLYVQPETAVTQVELESPICSGSVQFGDDVNTRVDINNQTIEESVNNDFSDNSWSVNSNNQ